MFKFGLLISLGLMLVACHTHSITPGMVADIQQSKRDFNAGFYKRAMERLLPLACDGLPEAQYGVGYMYYYGYGVAQDTNVGYFWIHRAAAQHYPPAVRAVQMIRLNQAR